MENINENVITDLTNSTENNQNEVVAQSQSNPAEKDSFEKAAIICFTVSAVSAAIGKCMLYFRKNKKYDIVS